MKLTGTPAAEFFDELFHFPGGEFEGSLQQVSSHFDGALGALDLELTADEIAALEAPYVPHRVVGALAPGESTLGAGATTR